MNHVLEFALLFLVAFNLSHILVSRWLPSARRDETTPASVDAERTKAILQGLSKDTTLHTVTLDACTTDRIESIRELRRFCPQHGLRVTKFLVDHALQVVRSSLMLAEVTSFQQQLEAAGLRASIY